MTTLIILGVIILVLILIIFPGSRVLLKGFGNKLVEDRAKTPEGAKIVYDEAIKEKKKDYTKAADTLRKLVGALETAKNNIEFAKNKLKNAEYQCEELIKQGKDDDANVMAQEVMIARKEIKTYEAQIAKFEPLVQDAKNIATTLQKQIKELEANKKINVRELELNIQNKQLFDSLDELRHSKNTDNLLRSVEEGIRETGEIAIGAKAIHENKLSTKKERIENNIADLESQTYLNDLKAKYSKK